MLTKDELITRLEGHGDMSRRRDGYGDPETAHRMADLDLLDYIDDPEISGAYEWIIRYYA